MSLNSIWDEIREYSRLNEEINFLVIFGQSIFESSTWWALKLPTAPLNFED